MTISTDYTTTTATTGTTSSSGSSTTTSADFDMFLKMLTTQMQNQDPLDPIDSSDYAVQLATFSQVEQQAQTNTLLTNLTSQMALIGMSQLAGWVGQQARAEVSVAFDGSTPVTLSPNPAEGADSAVLVVKDANGTLVAREEIPVEAGDYQWLGADAAGDPLPAGTYTLALESYSGETLLSTTGVDSWAEIVEVQGGTDGTTLVLAGGAEVLASDVTALRKS
ncbi:MAG: flagellar hook capping FlgD N-terminal domain-containing protein [Paracoccaceae bacterium]